MKYLDKIKQIVGSKKKVVLTVTGGGTGVFGHLLNYGGGSEFLVEGIINYSTESTQDLIGKPDSHVSKETALKLAVAAHQRCIKLGVDPKEAHGVSTTAKLVTEGEREGRVHEIYAAYHSNDKSSYVHLRFEHDRSRVQEEYLCENFILDALNQWFCGVDIADKKNGLFTCMKKPEVIVGDTCETSPEIKEIIRDNRKVIVIHKSEGTWSQRDLEKSRPLILPGSFNPIHAQHLRMADAAYKKTGKQVWLELSIGNTDKPALDYITLRDRVLDIMSKVITRDSIAGVVISNAPLFIQKAEAVNSTTFLVGMDTFNRMNEEKYNPVRTRETLTNYDARLMVFSRKGDKRLYPAYLGLIADFVSQQEYKDTGLSSTKIRNAKD